MLHPTHWYLNVTSYTYMYVLVHVLIENTLSQQKNDGHLLPYCTGLPDVTCMYTVVLLYVLENKMAATLSWPNFNKTIFAGLKYHSLTSS